MLALGSEQNANGQARAACSDGARLFGLLFARERAGGLDCSMRQLA